ncbi:MAG: hypothetical protein ABMA14_22785 [Hyphomonadaceae bacterium]
MKGDKARLAYATCRSLTVRQGNEPDAVGTRADILAPRQTVDRLVQLGNQRIYVGRGEAAHYLDARFCSVETAIASERIAVQQTA